MPLPAEHDSSGKTMVSSEDTLERAQEFEGDIAELKALYEQYFLGFERQPPLKKHDAVKKKLKALKGTFVRQTALKFRINNLAQKLSTYQRLWERTLTEIENGTYKRDVFKAKLHAKKRDAPRKEEARDSDELEIEESLDLSDFDADVAPTPTPPEDHPVAPVAAPAKPMVPQGRTTSGSSPAVARAMLRPVVGAAPTGAAQGSAVSPAMSPPSVRPVITAAGAAPRPGTGIQAAFNPAAAARPAMPGATRPVIDAQAAFNPGAAPAKPSGPTAPMGSQGAISDQKIKAIYDAYLMAKRRCGEDTSNLSLTAVADTLRKQVPVLMKQHQAKSVEFKVVIKDGKALLRALPKDE